MMTVTYTEKKTHKKAQSREEKGSRAQEREKQSEKKKKRKEMQFFNALTGEAGIPDFQTSEQTHGYNTLH